MGTGSGTFGEVAEAYIERYAKPKKQTWREDDRILKSYLLPQLKNVKATDVRSIVEKMAEETPVQANRTLAVIRKLYN